MVEIARRTFDGNSTCSQILDILEEFLNNRKNWLHVYKSLLVLRYCWHYGSGLVYTWRRKNIHVIEKLKNFPNPSLDTDGQSAGLKVRSAAWAFAPLMMHEDPFRLVEERPKHLHRPGSIESNKLPKNELPPYNEAWANSSALSTDNNEREKPVTHSVYNSSADVLGTRPIHHHETHSGLVVLETERFKERSELPVPMYANLENQNLHLEHMFSDQSQFQGLQSEQTEDKGKKRQAQTLKTAPLLPSGSMMSPSHSGNLGHKAFGKNPFRYSTKYFWLSDKPVAAEDIKTYLNSEEHETAGPVVAWSSQTGKGLLFYTNGESGPTCPEGILHLAYATDFVISGPDAFGFSILGSKHQFHAANSVLRSQWADAVKHTMAEGRAMKLKIESSTAYRRELELRLLAVAEHEVHRSPGNVSSRPTDEDTSHDSHASGTQSLGHGEVSRSHAITYQDTDEATLFGSQPRINTPESSSRELPQSSVLLASTSYSNIAHPEQILAGRLNTYFTTDGTARSLYTDTEIQEISAILKYQTPRWYKAPRTYVVLRLIGQLDLLDHCIDVGFSDYWFPVTERSLPEILRPSVRAAFVATQSLVLTQSMDLEKGDKGEHCYFRKGETLPFEMKGVLGRGSYGQVDRVLSRISFKEYARKRVLRSAAFEGKKKEDVKHFIAEIEILKRLKHQHVVEFVGSYTDAKYIGLIMLPIADEDLAAYLARASSANYSELRTFFGCLATALEFLHAHNVRHKDIKPSNILVSNGKVLFADFGLSFDFTDATGSTTMSTVNGKTLRYCAPEVANSEARNTMSDIWCLGVVFLEMVVTLKGQTIQYMDDYLRKRGSEQAVIRLNTAALPELIAHLAILGQWSDNKALEWIEPMLSVTQKLRPTASNLAAQITSPIRDGDTTGFCGICCVMVEEEDFSDYASGDE